MAAAATLVIRYALLRFFVPKSRKKAWRALRQRRGFAALRRGYEVVPECRSLSAFDLIAIVDRWSNRKSDRWSCRFTVERCAAGDVISGIRRAAWPQIKRRTLCN